MQNELTEEAKSTKRTWRYVGIDESGPAHIPHLLHESGAKVFWSRSNAAWWVSLPEDGTTIGYRSKREAKAWVKSWFQRMKDQVDG